MLNMSGAMTKRVSVHFEELYAPLGVWGLMNVYPTKNGIAVYFVDITEQKKIQEKIYNDGQNLRAIINNTHDLIWSVDRQSQIITGNQAFWDRVKELTGKNEDEVTNDDFEQDRLKVFSKVTNEPSRAKPSALSGNGRSRGSRSTRN